jgi:hypothetical protein
VLLGQGYRTPHGAVTDEYGAMVEWWLSGETKELGEKPTPVPLHPPGISLQITWNLTRVSTVRSQHLAAWVMARNINILFRPVQSLPHKLKYELCIAECFISVN